MIVVATFINSDNLYMTLCLRPAINLRLTILIFCFRLPPPSGASGNPTAGFGAGNHPHSHSELLNSINPHHPALSPNFLTSPAGFSQQEYLNAAAQRLSEMQASAALDPLNALEGKEFLTFHA